MLIGLPQRQPFTSGKTKRCELSRMVIGYWQLKQTLKQHSHTYSENNWHVNTTVRCLGVPSTMTRNSHSRSPGSALWKMCLSVWAFTGKCNYQSTFSALVPWPRANHFFPLRATCRYWTDFKQDQSTSHGGHMSPVEESFFIRNQYLSTLVT